MAVVVVSLWPTHTAHGTIMHHFQAVISVEKLHVAVVVVRLWPTHTAHSTILHHFQAVLAVEQLHVADGWTGHHQATVLPHCYSWGDVKQKRVRDKSGHTVWV